MFQVGDASFFLEKKRSSTPDVLKSRTRLSTELKAPECCEEPRNAGIQSSRSPVVNSIRSIIEMRIDLMNWLIDLMNLLVFIASC